MHNCIKTYNLKKKICWYSPHKLIKYSINIFILSKTEVTLKPYYIIKKIQNDLIIVSQANFNKELLFGQFFELQSQHSKALINAANGSCMFGASVEFE